MDNSIDKQLSLLMQGTEYGDEQTKTQMSVEIRERLIAAYEAKRPLKVYCGFDPRTPDLHLGHTVPMRKLRQFQELGHEVTFLVGTATSMIGDPSDKDQLRPRLSQETIMDNARTYAEQAFKILDREKTKVRFNHEWLLPLNLSQLAEIASVFTVQQFLQRDNFRKRLDQDEPIYLHETFYALMQAYDAVQLDCDVQVGGSDQLFNIVIAGRKVQKHFNKKPQIAIILGILPGTDGVIKMSKSLGNHIPLLSTSTDMYGKVMSIPDAAMGSFMRLVSRRLPHEIQKIEEGVAAGVMHPRDVKMGLAREIVGIFHSENAAAEAEAEFVRVFQKRGAPDQMPSHTVSQDTPLASLIFGLQLASSKSEARRLIQQNAVRLNGTTITEVDGRIGAGTEGILEVGKRQFVRLVASDDTTPTQ
jgi:tyrosyl-tRNA synthetase